MWDLRTKDHLDSLAQRGDLHELWLCILRICFPSSLGFFVHDNPPSLEVDRCFVVTKSRSADTCFVLTWSLPSKYSWNDPFQQLTITATIFSGKTIRRAHCNGTRFACSSLRLFSQQILRGREYRVPENSLHSGLTDQFPPGDADIFEPVGFHRFMLVVEDVYDRLQISKTPIRELNIDHKTYPLNVIAPVVQNLTPLVAQHGQQERQAEVTFSTTPQGELLHPSISLPLDILLEIIALLPHRDVHSLSLVNRTCNEITKRRLWRGCSLPAQSPDHAGEICNTLIRDPLRASFVLRLRLRLPATWPHSLIDLMPSFVAAFPNLQALILHTEEGSNFEPFLRALSVTSPHIQLKEFMHHAWLLPDAALWDFLHAMPSIEVLHNVDIFATRMPVPIPTFLPALRELRCRFTATAEYLAIGRPIETLQVVGLPTNGIDAMASSLSECPGPLSNVSLSVAGYPSIYTMRLLGNALQRTRSLTLLGTITGRGSPFPEPLANLEAYSCLTPWQDLSDRTYVTHLAARLGPRVRSIHLRGDPGEALWIREDGGPFELVEGGDD